MLQRCTCQQPVDYSDTIPLHSAAVPYGTEILDFVQGNLVYKPSKFGFLEESGRKESYNSHDAFRALTQKSGSRALQSRCKAATWRCICKIVRARLPPRDQCALTTVYRVSPRDSEARDPRQEYPSTQRNSFTLAHRSASSRLTSVAPAAEDCIPLSTAAFPW